MFTDLSLKKYMIDENNHSIGNVEVNLDIIKKEHFIRPFIREKSKLQVIKIGNRDYVSLDKYIIASLNDYYNRLMNAPLSERKTMLTTYQHLYDMWQDLHNFKVSKNFEEIDKMYDLFSYELYILGYQN